MNGIRQQATLPSLILLGLFFYVFLGHAHAITTTDPVPTPLQHGKDTHLFESNTSVTRLKITIPNATTVWNIPEKVKLTWDTDNIPPHKTIRFYLIKDDMVIQELGVFENNRFAEGISLNKSLQTANNYRVMGIELFPDNTQSIAKFATPYFTINGMKRVANSESADPKEPTVRHSFDGRRISYVDELNVQSDHITIDLWDHGRKDNDIVSIYLNGEAVVYQYHLTYYKKTFEITLDPSKPNDLFLYAHNLGKYPPNTVSMELNDTHISKKIVLNSDLKSCEAILINVKQ
ncbi:hypothetical protein [Maribacter sp. 2-571]|uniref:hypothetical protein n=1 Tax=Maribacter sp. 2-571 TaxID=3417569 RepID=UPI003D34FAC0